MRLARCGACFCAAMVVMLLAACVPAMATTGTTTTLTASVNPVAEGASTTFTATVKAASGSATPTGTVTVSLGTSELFPITLGSNGVGTATISTTGYPAGSYALTANYTGSSTFSASRGTLTVTIAGASTVVLQAVPNPVTVGQEAELSVSITPVGSPAPTGTATYYLGPNEIGTAPVSGGMAVLKASTTGLAPGTYPIYAVYGGDAGHGAGTSNTVNAVLLAAGGAACGTGNEAILNGLYSFTQTGYRSGSEIPFFLAGGFVANGKGGVSGGEEDFNFFPGTSHATVSSTSVYSVGADGRGCLTMVTDTQPTHTYRFSLIGVGGEEAGISDGGRMIEFDDTNGSGMRSTGGMVQVNASEIGLANLEANYSFGLGGLSGSNQSFDRASLLGTFAISTTGVMSAGETDSNYGGVTKLAQTLSGGTLSSMDGYGRSAMTFTTADETYHLAAYEVNKGLFFLVSIDSGSTVPIFDGEMHEADTGFTTTNVPATYVEHVSGTTANNAGYEQVLALTKFSAGKYTSTRYTYTSGSASVDGDSGSYTISSNGRLVLASSSGGTPEIFYILYKGIAAGEGAYVLGLQSPIATSGGADVQSVQTYSNSQLATNYGFGHDVMLTGAVETQSGEVTLSASGAVTGTVDESGTNGLAAAQPANIGGDFSFSSNGVGAGTDLIGISTGSNIYFLEENGSIHPILDMTVN